MRHQLWKTLPGRSYSVHRRTKALHDAGRVRAARERRQQVATRVSRNQAATTNVQLATPSVRRALRGRSACGCRRRVQASRLRRVGIDLDVRAPVLLAAFRRVVGVDAACPVRCRRCACAPAGSGTSPSGSSSRFRRAAWRAPCSVRASRWNRCCRRYRRRCSRRPA